MIAAQTKASTWMRTTVIVFEGDEQFRYQLQEEFAELGLPSQVVYDEDDVFDWVHPERELSDGAFFMLPLRGLSNRLAALRELRASCADIKLVLVSKDCTSRFIDLCISLGANAVIDRFESPEKIARLSMIVASAS